MKIFILFALIILASLEVACASSRRWLQRTKADFNEGELRNLSLSARGEITLSPRMERIADTGQSHVWSLVADSRGNIFAGTGNNGIIYKISDGEVKEFFNSGELIIHDLVIDKNDVLFAATSPRGIIFRISPDGEGSIFHALPHSFVWALVFDSHGNLFASTGGDGKIYKIPRVGKRSVFFASNQTHILSLAIDKDNNIFAGTAPDGLLFRIAPDGKAFAIYDAVETDIFTIYLDSSGILFGTAATQIVPAGPPPAPAAPGLMAGTNSIYRVSGDGRITRLFTAPEVLFLNLFTDNEGNIYAGTGNAGVVYKISPPREIVTLIDMPQRQVITSLKVKNAIYFGMSGGYVYRMSLLHYEREGKFISPVYDTSFTSRWGRVSWKEKLPPQTEVSIATRSGNVRRVDETWSEWSENYRDSRGEQITSPSARFIQYRMNFTTHDLLATPTVKEVSIAYLPHNQPPQIISISSPSLVGRGKTVSWKAEDPNKDSLIFHLYFRGEGAKRWKELKKDIKGVTYSFDSLTFPDGTYLLKLIASDSPDNPPEIALTDEQISEPFIIDNTRPVLKGLEVSLINNTATIKGEAIDNFTAISKIEYSLNAKDWIVIYPLDYIFDSQEELFRFIVRDLTPGEQTIVITSTDEAGNTGAEKITFEVP